MFLGIHEDTNAGAAAVDSSGRILAAVAEGRLTRVKYAAGFPQLSLDWLSGCPALESVQSVNGLSGQPITQSSSVSLVAANPYHPLPRVLDLAKVSGARDFRGPLQTAHLAWQQLLHRSSFLRRGVEWFCRAQLERRFKRPFDFVGHHACHGASAFFTGPWPEATVVTCDNMGDGESAAVFHGREGVLEPLWSTGAWHSPGQFYGEVASFLGIDPMTAGKVTGLAARGCPDEALEILRQRLRISSDQRSFVGSSWKERRLGSSHWRALEEYEPADVAAAGQVCLEEALVEFVREAVRTTGCKRVALAGGVFANVTLNRKLSELAEVEALWVHPAMSDQGIAVGAALLARSHRHPLTPRAMEHAYLGPSSSSSECAAALEAAGLSFDRPEQLPQAVAQLLSEGKVVGRFSGPLEYGPRALGNRSILCRPDDPGVNDWLNTKLGRSEYMPFAPVTLYEQGAAIYEGTASVEHCLPFMTVAVPVREPRVSEHAGVVHVDGTARPQLLRESSNPEMYATLEAFHRETSIPSLINTSFNRHGEPIVCRPEEAIEVFLDAGLDALVLGPFLVTQNRSVVSGA